VRRLERRPLPRSRDRRYPIRRPELLLALRRRPRLRWALAAGLAALTAVTVHGIAAAADSEREQWGASRAVAVAVHDLEPGAVVAPADVELRRLPRALVPDDALDDVPAGRVVTDPVFAGEPLDRRRLAPDGLSGVAALLPDRTRAVAVPADPATIPALAVGDEVDVVVAADAFGGPVRPAVAAARARVVHLGEESVTVAVPDVDAPVIAVAATGGLVALTLAGP
jgi:Flp pilus assembly protein CpaB